MFLSFCKLVSRNSFQELQECRYFNDGSFAHCGVSEIFVSPVEFFRENNFHFRMNETELFQVLTIGFQ